MSTCTSCGAPIVWAITEAGKRSPVDVEPAEKGNLLLKIGSDGQTYAAVRPQRDLLDGTDDGTRHVSHFVTCPQSAEHRRKR